MKPESLVFAVAGTCFGLIVGWVLGSQQAAPAARRAAEAAQAPPSASAPSSSGTGGGQPALVDEAKVKALATIINKDPRNAQARVQLANLYYDAERYAEAVTYYEQALKIDPKDVNVSTDLGVAYYYTDQPDRALKQFAYSLSIDPTHAKTILNEGIVRAFGKQDLDGAARAWERVIQLAPNSPEAQAAKRALDSMKSAHPGVGRGSS